MLEVRWFQFGIVALVLMCLLVAFSSGFIRINYYESFLLIHICLSIVLVYALFVSVFEGAFNGYLWPLVAIWSFDRLLRLIRVLYCNFHVRFSGSVLRTSSTTVTYDKASDVIRIDIQPASSLLKPAPGQYYHLYQPFALKGWENHPFSLGFYTTNPPPASLPPSPTTPTDLSKEIATATTTSTPSSSPPSLTSPPGPPTLTFYIRPYDGWTRRLRTACLAAPSHTLSPALLLEGPYGRPAPLHAFDTVVLLAGGTGIAAALPYVLDHAARAAAAPPRTRTTVLRLVWAVKRAGFVRALCAGELAGVLGRGGVEAEFYATAGEEAVVEEGVEKGEGVEAAGVEITRGRPDVRGLVGAVARETEESGGRAVVFVCGPAAMADEARAAVHGEMRRGCRGIEYVEDCFGW
ncbi:Bud-site selection protein BUD22 [Neofusicoccum parvum]|nr:Bud-site selection protein BUD22 [Neofusicoccum parvum]